MRLMPAGQRSAAGAGACVGIASHAGQQADVQPAIRPAAMRSGWDWGRPSARPAAAAKEEWACGSCRWMAGGGADDSLQGVAGCSGCRQLQSRCRAPQQGLEAAASASSWARAKLACSMQCPGCGELLHARAAAVETRPALLLCRPARAFATAQARHIWIGISGAAPCFSLPRHPQPHSHPQPQRHPLCPG